MTVRGLECSVCGAVLPADGAVYVCPKDGANLRVRHDGRGLARAAIDTAVDRSMWRYAPLLGVPTPAGSDGILGAVGGTPLVHAPRVAAAVGAGNVWIKDEGRQATGSLKDRASAAVVQRARAIGVSHILTASTGNAGVALAAMANAAGLKATVIVPATAPRAKIAQLRIYGAEVVPVRGTYDDAFELSLRATDAFGWYNRNTGHNPYTAEGKKTVAFEICEALGWNAPDRIYVSVGDGNILVGLCFGLSELVELGWIAKMPRIFGVQAEGSAAIANAWRAGVDTITPVRAKTIADSIAADRPSDGARALAAVRASGGEFVVVSDAAILEAMAVLAAQSAIFAEPAAAAAFAGLRAGRGSIARDETVVVLSTGSGLKDVDAAIRAVDASNPPLEPIEPSLEALKKRLKP